MSNFFDALRECDTRCFICFKGCSETEIGPTCEMNRPVYTMCKRCYRGWHYAMGWYAGRYGRVDHSMVNKDKCAEVEMLFDLYHEVVAETGVAEHEKTRAIKRAIHNLGEFDTLERSSLFYADIYSVLGEFYDTKENEVVSLQGILEKYGYFGVYEKLLKRLELCDAST